MYLSCHSLKAACRNEEIKLKKKNSSLPLVTHRKKFCPHLTFNKSSYFYHFHFTFMLRERLPLYLESHHQIFSAHLSFCLLPVNLHQVLSTIREPHTLLSFLVVRTFQSFALTQPTKFYLVLAFLHCQYVFITNSKPSNI